MKLLNFVGKLEHKDGTAIGKNGFYVVKKSR